MKSRSLLLVWGLLLFAAFCQVSYAYSSSSSSSSRSSSKSSFSSSSGKSYSSFRSSSSSSSPKSSPKSSGSSFSTKSGQSYSSFRSSPKPVDTPSFSSSPKPVVTPSFSKPVRITKVIPPVTRPKIVYRQAPPVKVVVEKRYVTVIPQQPVYRSQTYHVVTPSSVSPVLLNVVPSNSNTVPAMPSSYAPTAATQPLVRKLAVPTIKRYFHCKDWDCEL